MPFTSPSVTDSKPAADVAESGGESAADAVATSGESATRFPTGELPSTPGKTSESLTTVPKNGELPSSRPVAASHLLLRRQMESLPVPLPLLIKTTQFDTRRMLPGGRCRRFASVSSN